MASSIEFETWLATLPQRGYDRVWIGNNLPALQRRFEQFGDVQMPECPPATMRTRDRYEEL